MDCVFPKPAKSGEGVMEPVRSMIVHTAWMEVRQPCHSSGRKAGTEYGTLHGNTSHVLSGCSNDGPPCDSGLYRPKELHLRGRLLVGQLVGHQIPPSREAFVLLVVLAR